jgi:hypothetical protein
MTGRPPLEEIFAARRQAVCQLYLIFLTMSNLSLLTAFPFGRANVKMIKHARCEQQNARLLYSAYFYVGICLDRQTYIHS